MRTMILLVLMFGTIGCDRYEDRMRTLEREVRTLTFDTNHLERSLSDHKNAKHDRTFKKAPTESECFKALPLIVWGIAGDGTIDPWSPGMSKKLKGLCESICLDGESRHKVSMADDGFELTCTCVTSGK